MLLEINNLSFSYNKNSKILDNISFNLDNNDILCIVGPNGCGKSTLLKSLCNILDFDGEILINNTNIKNMDRKKLAKNIALMNQMQELYFTYTVYDTIMLGRYSNFNDKLFFSPNENDKNIVLKYINDLNIMHLKDKYINELSGGELQRVFLARVFVQEPSIIMLDEPTNHLDIKSTAELVANVKNWVFNENYNRAAVGIFHDINTALSFSNKILLLKEGKQFYFGNLEGFDKTLLNEIYNLDIKEYMISMLSLWNK